MNNNSAGVEVETGRRLAVGTCFHREHDPAQVIDQARAAEESGYDEFWVIEDCFYTAGVSLAAAALTATSSITVGIGIMPTVARNPAVTAMEIATLAKLAPGRFHAGIGHGVQSWMAQMDERRDSPVTMLAETLAAVRALIHGQELTVSGRYVNLDRVALEVPPDVVPPISAGVRGPKSLAVSGRHADGTILADFVSPAYLRWARERISEGRAAEAATKDTAAEAATEKTAADAATHRITVFASSAIGPDGEAMRQAVSPFLAEVCADAPISLRMAPFFDELSTRAEATSWADAVWAMPAEWWHDIAPIGTPDDAGEYLSRIEAAGADAVAVFPSFVDPIADVRAAAPALLAER